MAVTVSLVRLCPLIERFTGQAAFPYVLFSLVIAISLLTWFASYRCPQRLQIPIGCIGWSVAAIVLLFVL